MNPTKLTKRSVCALAIALALGAGASAYARHAAAPAAPAAAATPTPARPATGCLPGHQGYLRARLRSERDRQIDWRDPHLRCDGDVRPDGRGIRLTFAGRLQPGNHRVRFVFGIDAAAAAGVTHNVAADVTVIFEGEHRLYSTRGTGKCTVDDLRQQPIANPAAGGPAAGTAASTAAEMVRVTARGFCIGAAGAVGGAGQVLLSTFDFSGRMTGATAD
jgi:hypothetical protein